MDAESEFTPNPSLKSQYHRIKKSDSGARSPMTRKFRVWEQREPWICFCSMFFHVREEEEVDERGDGIFL